MRRLGQRGQSTAEYAILIALVIGAVIAMQVFVKRGLQGRMKDATDSLTQVDGGGLLAGNTAQYEPYYLQQDVTTTQTVAGTGGAGAMEEKYDGGTFSRKGQEKTTQTGTETTGGSESLGGDAVWLGGTSAPE